MSSQFTPEELHQWQLALAAANRNNIWCHCKNCDAEWVSSDEQGSCLTCGSDRVERILCWQFPDD
jgi:hypothetical protein